MTRHLLFAFLAACAPYKPLPDSGTPQDSGAKEASACVQQNQPCTSTSVCCLQSEVCNLNTGFCQVPCANNGTVCTTNGQCCSGICNGTCE